MKVIKVTFSLLVSFFIVHLFLVVANASHCNSTNYDCQINEIQTEINALTPAHEKNKTELANLNKQISSIKTKINTLSAQLKQVEADIAQREEDLAFTQVVFEKKTNSHYRFIRTYDPISPFLASDDASTAFREVIYRARAADEDRRMMDTYTQELEKLKTDKTALEKNKASLSAAKMELDKKASTLGTEVAKVENYLAELSAKQQSILAAKAGSFITSVGDSELADDYYASIKGFKEQASSGSFAVFSFGGYTHRKGMSQYGARGRAENGQKYRQILQAYYGKEPVGKDTSGDILVNGTPMNFEDRYLLGIAEMPSSWNIEALKAQAVAARTYAYRYKIEGKSICTTQYCQVFSQSKADNPPSEWKQAVQETRGQVLEGVTTFYSSTSGGYLATMGWDTTDGSGGGDFVSRAWESRGGSPWLYKAWYRQGYTANGATCERGNPWLSSTELADIVNAALVLKNRSDDRVTPVTTSCWGGNPYNYEEMRAAAAPYGGIGSVSTVTVLQGNGITNEVVVNGSIRLSWSEFKRAYNVRAPGYLRIPQGVNFGSSTDFAFFNIEQK